MSHAAYKLLDEPLPRRCNLYVECKLSQHHFCGIQLEELKKKLPHRRPTTHLIYHGQTLVITSKSNGKHLEFHTDVKTPLIQEYLQPLNRLLDRDFQPLKYLRSRDHQRN